jgi:small-conductance mechanosensitive channel
VLTGGTLASTFIAVLLYAAARILEALVAVLLGARAGHWTARWSRLVRLSALAVWIYITLQSFRSWDPAVALVSALLDKKLAFGATSVSVGNVVAFLVAIVVAIVVARVTRLLLDSAVLPGLELPRGVPTAISKTIQYVIVGAGVLLAMLAGGLDMARFGFLAGALGVGIGFGLQNIVNNFVSGIILLYERPIQEGDVIEAGQILGVVRRIGTRSSTVRTFDGAEVVVPNANLISAEVTNWTLSDRACRVELKLGVAYGTDPRRVLEVLRGVVRDRSGLLARPAPIALFSGMGESSLDFVLRFWVPDFEDNLEAKSAVLAEVYAALGEAGIQIPFPQRDLHLRSVDPAAAAALAGGDRPGGRER